MSTNFKPGDVAMVTLRDGSPERQMTRYATNSECGWFCGDGINSEGWAHFSDDLSARGATARPLVVIDPEDREQVERLLDGYWAERDKKTGLSPADRAPVKASWYSDFQQALREFANPAPPKPDEPMGLGAVVEDEDGLVWVRVEPQPNRDSQVKAWRSRLAQAEACIEWWSNVPAVKVLSEGVTQ